MLFTPRCSFWWRWVVSAREIGAMDGFAGVLLILLLGSISDRDARNAAGFRYFAIVLR